MVIAFFLIMLYKIFQFLFLIIKKLSLKKRKKRLENYFNLYDLKKEINDYQKKKTNIIFCCEKIREIKYTKLIIFGTEYALKENKQLKINIDRTNPLKSDFSENVILKSENGEEILFIINICYHMDNYYQIIMDKMRDPLALEIVFYSKRNNFPQTLNGSSVKIKNYAETYLPHLKRYNIINISKIDFCEIFRNYSSNDMGERINVAFDNINSFFVNFIDNQSNQLNNKYIGKIFEQIKDQNNIENFNDNELNLLRKTDSFLSDIMKNKKNMDDSSIIYNEYYNTILGQDESLIKGIIEKITSDHYFIKYYGKNINNDLIKLIEVGFFMEYCHLRGENGVELYWEYIDEKSKALTSEYEFNNFQKLMILVSLHRLLLNNDNIKLLRLYDLPKSSPFVESEKIFLDIINELNTESCLYFFYLQINSPSGTEYTSFTSWYQIKYIPLIEIKAHLIYNRFRFFFTYKNKCSEPAFVNLQTLVQNYNTSKIISCFRYKKSLEIENNIDNTGKLLIYKLHENSHSKYNCKLNMDNSPPRYLYSYKLDILDSHYDTILDYKSGNNAKNSYKYGEEIGEEGYAIELYLYGDYTKTDLLLNLNGGKLENFCDSKLYSGNNFEALNKLINVFSILYICKKIKNENRNNDNKNKQGNYNDNISHNIGSIKVQKLDDNNKKIIRIKKLIDIQY